MLVCVKQMQEVTDKICGVGGNIFVSTAGLLERIECRCCEGCAITVGAAWVFKTIGCLEALRIVGWQVAEMDEEFMEMLLLGVMFEVGGHFDSSI
jgi:hypothetical protein